MIEVASQNGGCRSGFGYAQQRRLSERLEVNGLLRGIVVTLSEEIHESDLLPLIKDEHHVE